MFFSDLHVQLLARGILDPGEQLVAQTVTSYMPWWAFGLVRRQYLVLATDRRLILVDHRYSFLMPTVQRLHAVDSMPWSSVEEVKVKGLFMKKKLRVRGAADRGPINLTMPIPNGLFGLLAPMKGNVAGARGIAAGFEGMQAGALPPASTGYGQPQISYVPPAPQLAPQAMAAPQLAPQPMPAQNAPGYASAPPPAPNPYGVVAAPPPPHAPPGPRSWS